MSGEDPFKRTQGMPERVDPECTPFMGSPNGTFVNKQRVWQHPIRMQDKLRLGAIAIQIAG